MYWRHDYPGLPGPPNPKIDSTRIFSSPVVADGRVLFGVDEDGQSKSAGYVVAASLDTGDPVWEFQTDVGANGHVRDDSCGSVWSSGSVLPDLGLVVFGTADCNFLGSARYADAVMALHIGSGTLAWLFHPLGHSPACDDDFGASANVGVTASGKTSFLGAGSKDGTYYSLNPATGRQRWATNVVFGGSSGGFIGGTAYDGRQVYGATGIGDFLPTKRRGADRVRPVRSRRTPRRRTQRTMPSTLRRVRSAGRTADTSSFSPTTVAGGMVFNGPCARSQCRPGA